MLNMIFLIFAINLSQRMDKSTAKEVSSIDLIANEYNAVVKREQIRERDPCRPYFDQVRQELGQIPFSELHEW